VTAEYRYTPSRAGIIHWDDEVAATAESILLPADDRPEETELLDANGNRLYRVKVRLPFGFVAK
jgi:hypothetical protein